MAADSVTLSSRLAANVTVAVEPVWANRMRAGKM